MKACKRWFVPAGAACSLCRQPATEGVQCDLATPVELTTIMKFVCLECCNTIALALGFTVATSRGQR
jgi:hypothetical protein